MACRLTLCSVRVGADRVAFNQQYEKYYNMSLQDFRQKAPKELSKQLFGGCRGRLSQKTTLLEYLNESKLGASARICACT
jgi:hypothetical protein